MQLFALNDKNQVVQAFEAIKKQNYICLECQEPLRVRGGEIRQAHFYHVRPNQKCSLHQKSLKHLQVQWRLQQLVGKEDSKLECSFSSIQRIADVVWLSEKIVFEVQCSPISAKEISERNADYESLGFSVVWLLHDSRFNQWRVSAAENVLKNSTHYFTDIDRHGEGRIYDQYAYIHQGVRWETGAVMPLDIRQVVRKKAVEGEKLRVLKNRMERWALFFKGDLRDSFHCQAALQIQKRWDLKYLKEGEGKKANYFRRFVIKPYLSLFRYFLDSVCD